jgi:hypothetical protein
MNVYLAIKIQLDAPTNEKERKNKYRDRKRTCAATFFFLSYFAPIYSRHKILLRTSVNPLSASQQALMVLIHRGK